MIIQKVEVLGPQKPTAALSFFVGLNVVAGASDTGKSYVIQCLQFALGASSIPKPIKESTGYDQVTVTLFDNEDGTFSLSRKLQEGAETVLKRAKDNTEILLTGRHRKGFDNLSNRFLRKFGLNDKLLLKSKEKLTTQSLSLRTLENILIVDETRIVASYSPLGTGQRGEQTLELSMLSTLMTGKDNADAKAVRGEGDAQGAINRKISVLEELIESLYPLKEFKSIVREEIEKQVADIDAEIEAVDRHLLGVAAEKYELLQLQEEKKSAFNRLSDEYDENLVLINRFGLLANKYQSNSERLEGIIEASGLLGEFSEVACPICSHELNPISNAEVEVILQGAGAELEKTKLHLRDLNLALEGLGNKAHSLEEHRDVLEYELQNIDRELAYSLSSALEMNATQKNELYDLKERKNELILRLSAREKALFQLDELRKLIVSDMPDYELDNFDEDIEELTKSISAILERWGFPGNRSVQFSVKARDIIIGDVPRAHFGKGYRAVAFAAFIVGLMVVLKSRHRHPGFVVLDSPLTTYKKADQERGEKDESVESDMVYALYRDLCDSYKDEQIIIFDNQEPDEDLRSMMNYIHFSKNPSVGRYGFFPINKV